MVHLGPKSDLPSYFVQHGLHAGLVDSLRPNWTQAKYAERPPCVCCVSFSGLPSRVLESGEDAEYWRVERTDAAESQLATRDEAKLRGGDRGGRNPYRQLSSALQEPL